MNPDEIRAKQAFQAAYQALKRGDRATARRWAFKAAALWPDYEEVWLILAAVASPHASTAYLERALLIHPDSPRALAGMRWAQKRLQARPKPVSENHRTGSPPVKTSSIQLKWYLLRLAGLTILAAVISIALLAGTILQNFNFGSPAAPGLLPKVTAAAETKAASLSSLTPTAQLITPSPPLAEEFALPTLTATYPPTQTVVNTPTPNPTQTSTFTATAHPSSTPTQVPASKTPIPAVTTYIIRKGDTLAKIASVFGVSIQSLAQINNILNPSIIRAGQKLTIPSGGNSIPNPAASGQKRIVVDLSEQHLYAYLDNQLVYSFVVSTGRGGGTLTGSFSILDKDPNAYSDPWGFWMPDWLGIYYVGYNLENGIHSLPVLPGGTQIWGDAIGTPISYGCVVLRPDDARQIFDWADIGTPVQIKN